jgi:hypothetical protein
VIQQHRAATVQRGRGHCGLQPGGLLQAEPRRNRDAANGGREMNEDRFNMDVRKFLKVVGVTSQREIEKAVRDALAKGTIKDGASLTAQIKLSLPEIGLEHVVDGEIGLS